LLGLFIWLEVLWGSLWVSKFIAMAIPAVYVFGSGIINSGVRKHHPVVRMIETPISLFFWTIIAESSVVPICTVFDRATPLPEWLAILRKVCVASIAVSAMVILERFVIQLINISYSEKQFCGRVAESKRKVALLDALYVQSTIFYPPFCPRFA
jgi:hypothetical protein